MNYTQNYPNCFWNMTTMLVDIQVHLKSVYHQEPPNVILKVDEDIVHSGELNRDTIFEYNGTVCQGVHNISLELLNKKDSDCVDGKDKAVIIDKILFFGIDSGQVLYKSTYVPMYSEEYIKSSLDDGVELDSVLESCNYLGWNGVWEVQFTAPIFTWLHNIENLGWVYPK